MAVIIILLCAAVYVFGNQFRDVSFWEELVALYGDGQVRKGAGFFSGLLGIPLTSGLGSIGAKIFTLLLLFVAVMILTGTSLIKLFRVVSKPAGAAAAAVGSARDRRREERGRSMENIDVSLDKEELPQHPVQSAAKARPKSEKLKELEEAFEIAPRETKKTEAARSCTAGACPRAICGSDCRCGGGAEAAGKHGGEREAEGDWQRAGFHSQPGGRAA